MIYATEKTDFRRNHFYLARLQHTPSKPYRNLYTGLDKLTFYIRFCCMLTPVPVLVGLALYIHMSERAQNHNLVTSTAFENFSDFIFKHLICICNTPEWLGIIGNWFHIQLRANLITHISCQIVHIIFPQNGFMAVVLVKIHGRLWIYRYTLWRY